MGFGIGRHPAKAPADVEGRGPASPNALTYDALGRPASTNGSSVTQFAYAGDQLLGEYDGSGKAAADQGFNSPSPVKCSTPLPGNSTRSSRGPPAASTKRRRVER